MSPELITAIKERLDAGQDVPTIKTSVLAMGHTEAVFDAALVLAEHDRHTVPNTLPRARDLFARAWSFALSRLDLVGLLFVPLAISSVAAFQLGLLDLEETSLTLEEGLSMVIFGIGYFAVWSIVLRAATGKTDEEKTIKGAAKWALRHALPLFFILVLLVLIMLGGFLFFIIPGIIVGMTTFFAPYIFVSEGKRGMTALLASRALVRGRWFAVFRKVFGFSILTAIPVFILGIIQGILLVATAESTVVVLGGELVIQALSAVMSVMMIHAMHHLYVVLAAREETSDIPTVSYPYLALVGLGVAFVIGVIALVLFFKDEVDWVEESPLPLEGLSVSEVPGGFAQFETTATEYRTTQNGSFTGVCGALRPLVEGVGEVVCNDSETAWALQVTDEAGQSYCADNTMPVKTIPTSLENRTKCIAIGE